MQREKLLAGTLGALVVVTVVLAAVAPGALAERDDDVRPSHLDVREGLGSIRAETVGGETVTFALNTSVSHAGGPAENVTVEVRAVDAESGLLVDRDRVSLGRVAGDRSVTVPTTITVPREGGYDVETYVYENGTVATSSTRSISNVDALTPEYARSSVRFQKFRTGGAQLPSVTYSIDSADGDRVRLNVSSYVQNAGADTADELTLRVRARQAESNVVADQTSVRVGSIRQGRTATPSVTLEVPDGYNYWLDAILLKDGVIVDTASEAANLDPQRTLRANETVTDVGFRAEDFGQTGGDDDRTGETPRSTENTVSGSGPGMGFGAVIVALAGAILLARRKS